VKEKVKPAEILCRLNTHYGEENLSHVGVCVWYSKFSKVRKKILKLLHAHIQPAANAAYATSKS
jgi:hypothetical protein